MLSDECDTLLAVVSDLSRCAVSSAVAYLHFRKCEVLESGSHTDDALQAIAQFDRWLLALGRFHLLQTTPPV